MLLSTNHCPQKKLTGKKLPFLKSSAIKSLVVLVTTFLLGLTLTALVKPPTTQAACYCEDPGPWEEDGEMVGCRCTLSAGDSGTDPQYEYNERGVVLWCDEVWEANNFWNRMTTICGTNIEIVPWCAHHRVVDGNDWLHNELTCWGTQWTSNPEDLVGPLAETNALIGYNPPGTVRFNSGVWGRDAGEDAIDKLYTCRANNYCCNGGDRCNLDEGKAQTSCPDQDGSVPLAGLCKEDPFLPPYPGEPPPGGWEDAVPRPPPYVPCSEVRPDDEHDEPDVDLEFHTYRPYQASPCLRDTSELALFCGNTLNLGDSIGIEKHYDDDINSPTYEYGEVEISNSDDAFLAENPCPVNDDGLHETCVFYVSRDSEFAVDLHGAQFPIMGFTEPSQNNEGDPYRVVNSVFQDETLSTRARANEYVSWYFNGIANNPTEYGLLEPGANPLCLNPLGQVTSCSNPFATRFENIDPDVDKIINFPGILRKVLPHRKLRDYIFDTTFYAAAAIWDGDLDDPTDYRHNQVIGCISGGEIVPCYTGDGGREIRLIDLVEGSDRPPEEDAVDASGNLQYPTFVDWLIAYRDWRGDFCVNLSGFLGLDVLLCADNPFNPNWPANLYFNIPLSSTEDRAGSVAVTNTNTFETGRSDNVEFRIMGQDVSSTPALLYFSHMQEVTELADILQRTYTACTPGVDEDDNPICAIYEEDLVTPVSNVEYPNYCEITEIRSNPGDELFAGEIEGSVHYVAELSCEFWVPGDGRFCTNLSEITGGRAQDGECLPDIPEIRCPGFDPDNDIGCVCDAIYGRVDCPGGTECVVGCDPIPGGYPCNDVPPAACYPDDPENWDCPIIITPVPTATPDPSVTPDPVPTPTLAPPLCPDFGYPICGWCTQRTTPLPDLTEYCNVSVMTVLETETGTPLADEAWSRLVAGDKGVFRRIYPKIEPDSPVEAIIDIPAATSVSFSSETNPVLIGNPAEGRDLPELYFPHIGGIHQYFLQCIQTALRPQGFAEGCLSGTAGTPGVNLACLGPSLAKYMNTILESIDDVGGLEYIRLLSTTLNLTNPDTPELVYHMVNADARFSDLDGLSGTAYNCCRLNLATAHVDNIFDQLEVIFESQPEIFSMLDNLPLLITETGDFVDNYGALVSEVDNMVNNRGHNYMGALLWNAFNTQPAYESFRLSDGQIRDICSPGGCNKVGVNSARYYPATYDPVYNDPVNNNFYDHADDLNMDFTLAILEFPFPEYTPQDPTLTGIIEALDRGLTPVIRVGTMERPGPSAQVYAEYLIWLNQELADRGYDPNSDYVYAILGPNEPVLEPWIEEDCYYPATGPTDPGSVPPAPVPSACRAVSDSQVPDRARWIDSGMKDNFIDLADRWCATGGENLAEECYNYVVRQSLESEQLAVNPAFTLTVWLNETGASNYPCSGPGAQDFGINDPTIAMNFTAQLERFLNLPFRGDYIDCGSSCISNSACLEPMHSFLGRFRHPGPDPGCGINETGTGYYNDIKGTYGTGTSPWQWVVEPLNSTNFCIDADNTFSIGWPSDNSCP